MNANSQQKTPTYDSWLDEATTLLNQAGIASARLDAELILAHTIRKNRTYIHAHGNDLLEKRHKDIANARLELRQEQTPVAYIVGHKEFYGRKFKTTPAALIPRPETETMIDLLAAILSQNPSFLSKQTELVDVGTGTGCIGITAKLEWPKLNVTSIDKSNHALNLAKENAKLLRANVHFMKNDLLHGYALPINILLANLPYVDRKWEVSADTCFEPDEALYAENSGLFLIKQLIIQASSLMNQGSYMLIESDPRQQTTIIRFADEYSFVHRRTSDFISVFEKY